MQPVQLFHYPMRSALLNTLQKIQLVPVVTRTLDREKVQLTHAGKQVVDQLQEILPEGYLLLKVRKDGKVLHAGLSNYIGYPIQNWIKENPFLSNWFLSAGRSKDKAQRIWLNYLENVKQPIRIWFHYPGCTQSPVPLEIHRTFGEDENESEESVLILIRDLQKEYSIRKKARGKSIEAHRKFEQLRSDFAAHLHDWKLPLSTIISSTWLCQRYNKVGQEAKQSMHLNRISVAVNELKMDFQNWQIWNEPNIEKEQAPLSIRSFVEQRIEIITTQLKHGQKINYWHQGVDQIQTDSYALRHILDNLIANAIKYSPEETRIDIHIWADPKKVRFQITDQGIGIPKEDLARVMEPRFRASNSNGIPGNGLGLSNVNKLVKELGGSLEIQSTLNHGTTFILTIQNQN